MPDDQWDAEGIEGREQIIAEIAEQIRAGRMFLFVSLDDDGNFGMRTNLCYEQWEEFAAHVIRQSKDVRQSRNN